MSNEYYKLVGEVTIPDDKKSEFNENVIKILDRCGLRKIKRKIIDGVEVELAARVAPDNDGIVHFDYSIYENRIRDESTYDMNSCHLEADNKWLDEVGLATAMILTLTEAYSSTPCYVAEDGEICGISFYALFIEDILGIRLRFPHRADIWTLLMFSRECEEIKELKGLQLLHQVPRGFEKVDFGLLFTTLYINNESLLTEDLKEVVFSKNQVEKAKERERYDFLYSLFTNMKRNGDPIENYLQKLIVAKLEERTAYAMEESDFGKLAELSRYCPSQELLLAYEIVMSSDFWREWENFAKQGFYTDWIITENNVDNEKERETFHFYKAIGRDDENEALGEFSDRTLDISGSMENKIIRWREQAESAKVPDNYDSISELKKVLLELRSIYSIRRMDYDLLEELYSNPQKETTKKVILLLRNHLDNEVFLFPELTREQAKKWVIEPSRSEYDKRVINGLLGLLANKEKRMELLGF